MAIRDLKAYLFFISNCTTQYVWRGGEQALSYCVGNVQIRRLYSCVSCPQVKMMAEAPEPEAAAAKHAYESLSESDDEPDEVTRLRVTRPNILKDEFKNEYKGRQVMSNFFDILEQAERDEIEEANQPPPKYYWSEGVRFCS